jgi:hypothetical protein
MTKIRDIAHRFNRFLARAPDEVDPVYDLALEKFTRLNIITQTMKTNYDNYLDSMQKMFISSNGVIVNLENLIEGKMNEDPNNKPEESKAEYKELAHRMHEKHTQLLNTQLNDLKDPPAGKILKCLYETTEEYRKTQTKINQRAIVRKDYNYYADKVKRLQRERDRRAALGKEESFNEHERLLRNQHKLEREHAKCVPYNEELRHDMNELWANRISIDGALLNWFAQLETNVADIYYITVKDIKILDLDKLKKDFIAKDETPLKKEEFIKETTPTAAVDLVKKSPIPQAKVLPCETEKVIEENHALSPTDRPHSPPDYIDHEIHSWPDKDHLTTGNTEVMVS